MDSCGESLVKSLIFCFFTSSFALAHSHSLSSLVLVELLALKNKLDIE